MEEDYLVRLCEIPTESVEVGAAPHPVKLEQGTSTQDRRWIVFFSEPYEMAGGRGKGFYQDILPSLADLALSEGRELIVKLHPSESVAERSRLVRDVLSAEQQRVARIVVGAVTPEMLAQTWFGITVMSTAVVDCVLQQVPCFLCGWLETWAYGYCDQFARFEVGIRLSEPAEIGRIPLILQNDGVSPAIRENCWAPIEAQRLEELLGLRQQAFVRTRDQRPAKNSR
jgi:hypothetical protein